MPVYANPPRQIQTASVPYKSYDFDTLPAGPLQLIWPTSYQDSPYVVASWMDFGGATTRDVILPDAMEVSVGQSFVVRNLSGVLMTLKNFDGVTIDTITSGLSKFYILTTNTTPAGTWSIITFGAGISEVTASELRGYGLNSLVVGTADGTELNTEILPKLIPGPTATYQIITDDYTRLIVWTSGAGNMYLPVTQTAYVPPNEAPPGFYVAINNAGSGILTLYPNALDPTGGIQGQPSITIAPQQTLMVISNGDAQMIQGVSTKWFTLGLGQQPVSQSTYIQVPVSGNSDIFLTPAQISNEIIEFSGVLTGNINVYFPPRHGQWSLFNNTTGAFTLTVQLVDTTPVPIGTAYLLPQGNRFIYYSNGTSLFDIPAPFDEIPGGATEVGQVLHVTGLGPQTVGWGPLVDERNTTLGIGTNVNFPLINASAVLVGRNIGSTNNAANNNIIIGIDSFLNNTTGNLIIGIGEGVLQNNTTGASIIAVGYQAAALNTDGVALVGVGINSLLNNSSGVNNAGFGHNALNVITIGSRNTAVGNNSGANANNLNNTTAVGYGATVSTSNSLVLGSDVNVGIGTTAPTEGLHLGASATNFNPRIYVTASTAPAAPSAANDVIFSVTAGQGTITSGTSTYTGGIVTGNSVGAAATVGTATLVAGTVTVATTSVTANSRIFLTVRALAGVLPSGVVRVPTRNAGANFVISSTAVGETSQVDWLIVNPQ